VVVVEDKASAFRKTKEDKDGFEDDDGCPDNDNDQDGIADAIDKCPNDAEDKDNFEDDDGCPDPDNDKDGICDDNPTIQKHLEAYKNICKGLDKCPNEPETVNGYEDEDGCPDKVLLVKVTKEKIELSQKVFFEYNKSRILPQSFQLLKDVATVLKDRPTMEVRIEGHTDSTGSAARNRKLSQERASSVRAFLIKEGVDPGRMISKGYGPDQPIANNRLATGREKNRRVEFFITKQ
jgi:outer membrane protein OmpA-like peptidoglycan-associated protein